MTHPPVPNRPRSRPATRLALHLAVAAGATMAGCSQPDAVPFDPHALQAMERAAADESTFRRLPPLGEPPLNERGTLDVEALTNEVTRRGDEVDIGLMRADATEIRLPLQECIRRAALNNFDVAVAAYGPAIEQTRVVEALARFDPVFQQQVEFQYSDRQITNQSFLGSEEFITDEQRTTASTTALSQQLSSGGQAELSYRATYLSSPTNIDRGFLVDETWESDLSLRFTQPLLRDFGRDINRARIVINRNTQRISVFDFRDSLEETLLEVERTYWQLYRAQREVEIQTDLLNRTVETAQRISSRLGIDANAGQVAQALLNESDRRVILLQATAAVTQLSDRLKALMNDPDLPVTGDTRIITATEPVMAPLLFDLEDAIDTALLYRTEIAQQLLRVQSAGTALSVGRNNVLPRLDAVLSGGIQGLDQDFGGAVENQVGFDNLSGGVGLQFEIPLGNRAARSILRRALLQRAQAIAQYAALINQISLEVKTAQIDLSTAYAVLKERRQARQAAEESVRVIEAQEADGAPLTPEFSDRKLRFLASLATALSTENQAIAEYNAALAAYERAKGTLLRYNNVVLAEGAIDVNPPVGRSLAPTVLVVPEE